MIFNKRTCIASLSGLQYGYNTSIIASALLLLKNVFSLSVLEQGLVVSAVLLGGLAMSLFSGKLANLMGRKGAMSLCALLFTLGVALSAFTSRYLILLLGRFIVGMASALSTQVPPIYLMETSPVQERGASVNINQITIAGGSLIAYLTGYLLAEAENWRLMFALGCIPGIIQFIGLFFLPESPYKSEMADQKERSTWKNLLNPLYRPQLFLGLALCASQSLIGSPAIFYFTPSIFESAGMGDASDALSATVLIGAAYLMGILVSFGTVDQLGRRPLTLFSLFGMILSLLVVALFFYFDSPILFRVLVPSLLFFVCCYAIGMGPIPFLIIGEITPTHFRAQAIAISGMVGTMTNYLITLTCPIFLHSLGLGDTFVLYSLMGAGGVLYLLRALPETKQKDFQEIAKLFNP